MKPVAPILDNVLIYSHVAIYSNLIYLTIFSNYLS